MGETVGPLTVEYRSPSVRRVAWLAWIGMAIVIGLILYFDDLNGRERSVVPNYRAAVVNWIAGKPLYNMGGSGFVYAPQCALVFVPWAMLPKPYGEIVWSWTILAVLAVGVFRLTRMVSHDDRWFLINTVVTAAISAGCARNGQATLIITGLMLLATVELKAEHWWRATVLLTLAFAFKPVAFVMILLVAVIYRPMLWRLAVATVFVAIAPFLVARPEYAMTQCVAFYENSRIAFKDGETGYWAHIYGMLKVFGLDLPSPVQQTGRVVFAVGTLAACWLAARKLPQDRGLFFLFANGREHLCDGGPDLRHSARRITAATPQHRPDDQLHASSIGDHAELRSRQTDHAPTPRDLAGTVCLRHRVRLSSLAIGKRDANRRQRNDDPGELEQAYSISFQITAIASLGAVADDRVRSLVAF